AGAVQLEDEQLADGAEAVLRLDPERVLAGRDQLRRRQHRIGERRADRDQLASEDEDLEVAPRIAVPAHVALPARVGRRRRRRGRRPPDGGRGPLEGPPGVLQRLPPLPPPRAPPPPPAPPSPPPTP